MDGDPNIALPCDGHVLPCCMAAGSFSFPNVPPSAELDYDLELVDFEGVDEVCMKMFLPHHRGSCALDCSAIKGMQGLELLVQKMRSV